MKSQINLVSTRTHVSKGMSRILIGAIGIFGVSFLISMSVILYIFYLRSNLSTLDTQEVSLRSQINSNLAKKTNILILKERLAGAQKITDARKNLNTRLNSVLSLLPPATIVESIDASNEKIALTLATGELDGINSLLEDKIVTFTKDSKQGLSRIDIATFGRNTAASSYDLSLNFEYTKTK